MSFTHRELCNLAVNWLKRPASRTGPGCQVAFSESKSDWCGEIPDAIGFRAGVHNEFSVVIEVKTSRSDFLVDKKKPHRLAPETGMGKYRYFMAPEGLLSLEELPERWGLIEVTPRGHIKPRHGHVFLKHREKDVWEQERALSTEWTLLTLMLNRVGDAEKVQNWLKESRNQNAALVRQNEKLQLRNAALTRELRLAKYPELAEVGELARARRKPVEGPVGETQLPVAT
jgi:hypothetical protein